MIFRTPSADDTFGRENIQGGRIELFKALFSSQILTNRPLESHALRECIKAGPSPKVPQIYEGSTKRPLPGSGRVLCPGIEHTGA